MLRASSKVKFVALPHCLPCYDMTDSEFPSADDAIHEDRLWRDGHIEALYWPHIDNVATGTATSYALTDDVAGFRVAALTADNRWSARWPLPGGTAIPRGVRIELTLADGSTVDRLLVLQ